MYDPTNAERNAERIGHLQRYNLELTRYLQAERCCATAGIPDHMYSFPQEYDMDECGMHVVLITIFVTYQS